MFGRKRRVELPDVRLPDVKLPDVRLPDVRLPDVHLPDVRVPDLHLPDVRMPDLHLRDVRMPSISAPDVSLPDVRMPQMTLPLELTGTAPFVRRKRGNPVVAGLKFALGLGLGFALGCVLAALLAPAAGDDTRRRLLGALPGRRDQEDEVTMPLPAQREEASRARQAGGGAAADGIVGRLRSRFDLAMREARLAREQEEQRLIERLHTAQRTGHVPDTTP